MPSRAASREWWWILDPRQSLRARAALIVGLGALLFAALLTWLSGAVFRRALEVQLAASLETLAFQISDKLDRAVYERYRTLVFSTSLVAIRDPAADPNERRRLLEALQESSPDFAWLGIADPSGLVQAATGRIFENTNVTIRPWFRSARQVPYAGPLRDIAELNRSHAVITDGDNVPRFFDLSVPIVAAGGEFAGVLGSHVRWGWAREALLSVIPESLGQQQIGGTVYAGQDAVLDSGASGWTHPPDPPNVGDTRRARGYLVERTTIGSTYATGFARSRGFREFRGLGWVVAVRQPIDRAFAPVTALRRTIAGWGLVLTGVAMTLAWFVATPLARRLRSVRAAAERIHEGDILAVLPRPPGNSEMARMCSALGDLVEGLRASSPQAAKVKEKHSP